MFFSTQEKYIKRSQILLISFILATGFLGTGVWLKINAATKEISTASDFGLGKHYGTEAESQGGSLKLKTDGNWLVGNGSVPNNNLSDQAAIASDGENVYLLGNGDISFSRYLRDEDRWEQLANSLHSAYSGADLVVLGNYIYAIFGGYQKEFSRYSIYENRWTEMAPLPDLVFGGASLETNGSDIYCLRGLNTTDFWKYNPSSNSWSVISSAPATINNGANLVYSPTTNKLYTPRGVNTNTFYIYDLTSGNWSVGPTMPFTRGENGNIAIGGTMIYVNRGANTTSFAAFNVGTSSWSNLPPTPLANLYVGSVYNAYDNSVYVFRGNNTNEYWRFDVSSGQFNRASDLPAAPGTGSDLIYMSGQLYYKRGGSNAMYRSDMGVGATWQTLANSPVNFSDDTKGVEAGGLLYFFQGSGNRTFYSFNPTVGVGGTWAALVTLPTAIAPSYGAGLAYPGSGNYLYATRGGLSRTFMRYTIGVGETWDDAVVADLPDNAEAGYGSRIIGVGTTELFYIAGNGIARMLKYNITADTWTVLDDLPFSPYWGTDWTYYGGKIYAQAGYYRKDFWEYTIATNSWRRLGDIPGYNAFELGPYNGGSLESDGSGNLFSSAGMNVLWLRKYAIGGGNYPASGSWVSGINDLGYVAGWGQLEVGASTPGNSSVVVNTRTSSNMTSWSGWAQVSGGVIGSPVARYLQVGVTLVASSGGEDTPVVNSLLVNYSGDTSPPGIPTQIEARSRQVGGEEISSGGTYSYNTPYFSWIGATDADTSIEGYYVYFGTGTTSTVDPAVDGAFQTTASYLVTTPMETGTYRLLVKSKDSAGNMSDTWEAFEYRYNGVSPKLSVTRETTAHFAVGATSGVVTNNDQIRLAGRPGFWQQERLSVLPSGVYDGSDVAIVGNKMYILRGWSSNVFYIYDLETDVVSTGPTTPATVLGGGTLVRGPEGSLFALRGGNNSSFWKFDIGTTSWSDALALDTPQPVNQGADMVYDGSQYIYVLKGNSDDALMKYDAINDNWEVLSKNTDFGAPTNQINNLVALGGDLAMDTTRKIVYAIQGGTRTGFSSYMVEADQWQVLPNLPAMANNGARIEYVAETNSVYYIPGWDKPYLFKYDVANQTWSEMAQAPAPLGYGASLKQEGDYLYVLRGATTSTIFKYKISTNSWTVPNWNLFGGWWRGTDYRNFSNGADMVRGENDDLYITRGGYDNLFVKYNPRTGEVTKLADIPGGIFTGSEMVYDGIDRKIYATISRYDSKFMVYDVLSDSWSQVSGGGGTLPADPGEGSALAIGASQTIYWSRGANSNTFYKYSVNSGLWTSLPNAPGALQYGSDLVIEGDYIYATRGVGTTAFFRYGPLSGVGLWSSLPTVAYLPAGVNFNYDGFLAGNGGGKIIACRGGNLSNCLTYDVNLNSWADLGVSAPANITYGGAGVLNQAGDRLYMIAGAGTNTYGNGIYSYVVAGPNSAVGGSGSYVSEEIDLGTVYRFGELEVGYSGANNASLTVYTRTSADGVSWVDWEEAQLVRSVGGVNYYRLASETNPKVQVKLVLESSDGIYSGVVEGFSLSYYQDISQPVNPTTVGGYFNSSKGSTMVSDTFYGTTAPYFEWPGVGISGGAEDGDGGSGVAGYYIYFGVGETTDPAGILGTYTTATSYVGTTMVTGQKYYFRMKTKDLAGNVSSGVGQTFVFGYDASPPSNPTTITTDPQGYSASNSFSFFWSGAGDTGAGVDGYYYKTGAVGATEVYMVGTSVTGITAYQTGTNTFFVRTKDLAGNVSEYTTASYYYSATAPGAPRDLKLTYPAVGSSNTVNEFAFSWSTPDPNTYYGQQSGLRYYYSFNETPSESNVGDIGLALSYLSKGGYATRKGTNTLYVVAKDEAGNIDYRNYASVDFVAQTAAPGNPRNIDISDVSIKETSNWRVALSWDAPEATGSGVALYKIYRSETSGAVCSTDMSSFENVASSSVTSYVDPELEQVTYNYCVKACDSTNECGGASDTVLLKPDGKWRVAPTLTSEPAASAKTKTAVISWTTNRQANSFVKYGTKSGDYGDEVGSSDLVSSHSISLTGLDPGTTYYYKAIWTDEDGNTGESSEGSFQTNPAPFISAVSVEDIGLYSVYVKFTMANAIKVKAQYGKTTSYGGISELNTSRESASYTLKIDNLEEGSEYHLQLVAQDDEGNFFTSDDYIFETLPVPRIDGVKVQQVRGASTATVRVLWKTNTGVSSVVSFFPVDNPEATRDQIQLALTENHQLIISGLKDDTPYIFLIKGKDIAGNEAAAYKMEFKTSLDLRAPEITDMRAEGVVSGVGEQAKGQIVINWRTDEPATSQVEYGEGTGSDYSKKTPEETRLASDHAVSIPNLKPGMVYHLRVVSKDGVGNTTNSFDTVVVMPKATRSALDLVVNSLSKSFGFFSNLSKMESQ